jgi:hypothetical protein
MKLCHHQITKMSSHIGRSLDESTSKNGIEDYILTINTIRRSLNRFQRMNGMCNHAEGLTRNSGEC